MSSISVIYSHKIWCRASAIPEGASEIVMIRVKNARPLGRFPVAAVSSIGRLYGVAETVGANASAVATAHAASIVESRCPAVTMVATCGGDSAFNIGRTAATGPRRRCRERECGNHLGRCERVRRPVSQTSSILAEVNFQPGAVGASASALRARLHSVFDHGKSGAVTVQFTAVIGFDQSLLIGCSRING